MHHQKVDENRFAALAHGASSRGRASVSALLIELFRHCGMPQANPIKRLTLIFS